MADFVISAELNATNLEVGKRVAVSAADQLTQKFQNFINILKEVENRIQNVFKLLQSLKQIQFPTFTGVDEKALSVLKDVIKLRNTELKLIREKNKSDLEAVRNSNRLAEIAARGRVQAENAANRQIESERRREFSEFQRLEREKTRIAIAEIRNRNGLGASGSSGGGGGFGSNFVQSVAPSALTSAATIGGILGNVLGEAVLAALSKVKDLVFEVISGITQLGISGIKLAADFQTTVAAMTVFTGSSRLAKDELKKLAELAKNTPGLRLDDAQKGASQLRALGFTASVTRDLIAGLAKQKLFSGADEGAIQRILINLTQLKAGSPQVMKDIQQMVLSMPSLINVINDTFGSLDKFKAAIQKDPDAAIARFAKGMKDAEGIAGGLNDAIGKLLDAGIEAGRTFGEPILEPLTESVKLLTSLIYGNQNAFATWGQSVADNIRGVNLAYQEYIKYVEEHKNDPKTSYQKAQDINTQPFALPNDTFDQVKKFLGIKTFAERGKESRLKDEATKLMSGGNLENELKAQELQKQRDEAAKRERERLKELSLLKDYNTEKLALINDYYSVAQAIASSGINLTVQQEINSVKKISSIKAASISSEIAQQSSFFQRQISLTEAGSDEQKKVILEKNQTLSKLNTEFQLNEINTQKEIAQLERQILEKRRQDTISFKQLQVKELQQTFESKNFDIVRNINIGSNVQQSFDQLKGLTQKNFQDISRLTIEQYGIQLQNERLTKQERTNLNKQMYLELEDLAEKSRQRQIQISDDQYKEQIQLLEKNTNRQVELINAQSQSLSNFSTFFNPQGFGKQSIKAFKEAYLGGQIENEIEQLKERLKIAKSEYDKIFKDYSTNPRYDEFLRKNTERQQNITEEINKQTEIFRQLGVEVRAEVKELEALSKAFSDGTANIELFDKILSKNLENQQSRQKTALLIQQSSAKAKFDILTSQQRGYLEFLAQEAKDKKTDASMPQKNLDDFNKALREGVTSSTFSSEMVDAKQKIDLLALSMQNLTAEQAQERLEQYKNSLSGLKEEIKNISSGDKGTILGLEYIFNKDLLEQTKGQLIEIKQLEFDIANTPQIDYLNVEIERLKTVNDLRKQEERAVIAINDAQLRLTKQTEFSSNQVRANVLSTLAAQKDLNQAISDGILKIGESATNLLNKKLGKVGDIPLIGDLLQFGNQQIGSKLSKFVLDLLPDNLRDQFKTQTENPIAKPIVTEQQKTNALLTDIKNTLTPNIGGVTISTGGFGGGGGAGGAGGVGAGLLSLLFGSNKSGNVSTDSILTPDSVTGGAEQLLNMGGSRGGGIMSLLGGLNTKIFGSQGFGFGNRAQAVGTISGIGSLASLAGGFVPGVGGSVLSGIGSGIGAASSLSSILGISAIGGPLGLAIGGVIGGLVGLGSWLFGSSKQRKQDEATRTQAYQSVTQQFDEMIFKLTKQIPPGIDPAEAMTRGSQLIAEYTSAMSQLKDSKTRRIALGEVTNTNGIIYRKNQELQSAINIAQGRLNNQSANQGFTGMFASGGLINAQSGGHLVVVGEGGFDEYILSTDPRYQNRTLNLLSSFLGRMNLNVPQHRAGAVSNPGVKVPANNYFQTSGNNQNEPDVLNFEFNFNGFEEVVDVRIRSKNNVNYIIGKTDVYLKSGRKSE